MSISQFAHVFRRKTCAGVRWRGIRTCMGLFLSSSRCRFFVRSGKAVLRTRRLRSGSRRDDDLRQGLPQLRRVTVPVCGASEGSSPLGADLAPHTCIRSVRLDPDHDAVMRIGGKAPGGGPILSVGINAMFEYGFPPPRIGNSAVVLKSQRERRIGNAVPGGLSLLDAG